MTTPIIELELVVDGDGPVVVLDGSTNVVVEGDSLELTKEELTLVLTRETTEVVVEQPVSLDFEVPGFQGPQGFPGPQGPQGPQGVGIEVPYIFTQSSPANPWHIVHGRGSKPSVVVVRADGVVVDGFGVEYPDDNTVDVYVGLIAGQATLNF